MIEKFFSILIVGMIIFSFGTYAAGRSTNTNTNEKPDPTSTDRAKKESQLVNCDNSLRRDRIKCRLKNRDRVAPSENYEGYEACRGLSQTATLAPKSFSKEECRIYYERVNEKGKNCYDLSKTGRQRAICLREESGLTRASISSQNDNPRAVRLYIIGLLYQMQERVERSYEEEMVSEQDAADIIDLIVEAKQTILNGGSKTEIKESWQTLKTKWEEIQVTM